MYKMTQVVDSDPSHLFLLRGINLAAPPPTVAQKRAFSLIEGDNHDDPIYLSDSGAADEPINLEPLVVD